MLPVGLIGFILPEELEEGFYAVPPKNKFEGSANPSITDTKSRKTIGIA
jgi:hypothetical protein